MAGASLEDLAARFRGFAAKEANGVSPLYENLARKIADDPFPLGLAARSGSGQPPPNMLLAAVHALLLECHRRDPLAGYYASLTPHPGPPAQAFPAFRGFCAAHETAITGLLARRVVSTNEVQRSACLMPAFARVAEAAGGPLQIVEVGASAGLNLLWDRFAYDYGPAGRPGAEDAPLTLACEVRRKPPPLPRQLPVVDQRIGIDLAPLDPGNPEDAAWLHALFWPEQRERASRLKAALAIAAKERPRMIAGDALACLPAAVAALPESGTLCVTHAFTLNQFNPEARESFQALLVRIGRQRPVYQVALEWADGAAPELSLTRHDAAGLHHETLARCDAHGAWLEWLA